MRTPALPLPWTDADPVHSPRCASCRHIVSATGPTRPCPECAADVRDAFLAPRLARADPAAIATVSRSLIAIVILTAIAPLVGWLILTSSLPRVPTLLATWSTGLVWLVAVRRFAGPVLHDDPELEESGRATRLIALASAFPLTMPLLLLPTVGCLLVHAIRIARQTADPWAADRLERAAFGVGIVACSGPVVWVAGSLPARLWLFALAMSLGYAVVEIARLHVAIEVAARWAEDRAVRERLASPGRFELDSGRRALSSVG